MTAEIKSSLVSSMQTAATQAGLTLVSVTQGTDFHGEPTTVFELGLNDASSRALKLELTHDFDFDEPHLLPEMAAHLAAEAQRLRNPRPDCYVTLAGLPISFGQFQWPFHRSTSGADTYIVHGEIRLADPEHQALHAKVAASVTVTFAEIVPAMEQPYAETFIYNAIRKIVDLGQLEFLKSGNRQPVPVTTRFYSPLAKEVRLHRHRRQRASGLPAQQGLLALRRPGRVEAGLDRRSARRPVPEHHHRGPAAHGQSRSRRRPHGRQRRVRHGHPRAARPRPGVPGPP